MAIGSEQLSLCSGANPGILDFSRLAATGRRVGGDSVGDVRGDESPWLPTGHVVSAAIMILSTAEALHSTYIADRIASYNRTLVRNNESPWLPTGHVVSAAIMILSTAEALHSTYIADRIASYNRTLASGNEEY